MYSATFRYITLNMFYSILWKYEDYGIMLQICGWISPKSNKHILTLQLLFKLSKMELILHLGAPTDGNRPVFISTQSQETRKWRKFLKFLKCDVIWVIFGYQSNNFLTWWPEIDERFEILSFTYLPMFNRFLRFGFFFIP